MAHLLSLKQIFIISLLSLAAYCCKAQQADPVQIVAQAALCFDNKTVMNGCSRWMRRMSNRNAPNICGSPCFGQMMLTLNCMEGIFSNFQSYSPGLMLGVQSIFQMSCGGRTNPNTNTNTNTNTDTKADTNITSTNTSASGNIVVKQSEAETEKSEHKHWSSLWIIIFLCAVVAALVIYISPGNFVFVKEKLGFVMTTEK